MNDSRYTISFSMDGHTGKSLCNLVTMLYKMGELLSKSTGGCFRVHEAYLPVLNTRYYIRSVESFLEGLSIIEQKNLPIQGISFTNHEICFTGFPTPKTNYYDRLYRTLCTCMDQYAREHKYPLSKKIVNPNEAFTMRVWLRRIGLGGNPTLLQYRRLLLKPLSGDPFNANNPNHPAIGKCRTPQ